MVPIIALPLPFKTVSRPLFALYKIPIVDVGYLHVLCHEGTGNVEHPAIVSIDASACDV